MKRIILLCNAGMSTSLLMKKIIIYAGTIGFECTVEAYPVTEIDLHSEGADILLLGPQVKYELNNIKNKYPNIPVEVMDMRSYGLCDAEAIIKQIQVMLK